MANSPGVCVSFKVDQFNAVHAFGTTVIRAATTPDTFKMALYVATGSLSPTATTAYSPTSEVSGAGYSPGGVAVTNAVAPTSTGTTAYWTPSGNVVFTGVTLTTPFDTALLYNASQGNKACSLYQFTAQTIVAGTLSLIPPTNAAGTALLNAN